MPSGERRRPETSDSADVAALFDAESEGYDEAHEGPRAHLLHRRMEAVLETVGPGPGAALDAGMGPGRLCAELEARGWTVSGVDISERMVALAARRLPGARERMHRGSITELPFADGGFDAVAATGVLEYLPDPAAGIRELVRVLAPGGTLVVSIPNAASLRERWTASVLYPALRASKRLLPGSLRPPPPHKAPPLSAGTVTAMIRAAGASPERERLVCVQALPPPFDRALPRLARSLSRRLEPPRTRVSRVLATQVILAARKPPAAQDAERPSAGTS